ncbi:MAG: type III-B CRISPR module RAMP protein Cmr4 [Planctomycetota bacterium]
MTVRLLQVLTPLHLGEGAQVGAVDLPIARERHTDWPFVSGASLKGALRAYARRDGRDHDDIQRVFGAEPGKALFRGATSFGDGVLLILPARSFTSTFALLASPLTLGRFARQVSGAPEIPRPSSAERVLVGSGFDLKVQGKDLAVIEDLCFIEENSAHVDAWAYFLREGWLGDEAPLDHLAVVHDDVFAHAARAWLPVRTRNAIDAGTGVVDGHKLFSVEYVAPEALFWTLVDGEDALLPLSGDAFVLGGHNSTGSGRVTLWKERS